MGEVNKRTELDLAVAVAQASGAKVVKLADKTA
jgi:hypothetical protein